jgi:hypothetical protein
MVTVNGWYIRIPDIRAYRLARRQYSLVHYKLNLAYYRFSVCFHVYHPPSIGQDVRAGNSARET